MTKTTFLLPLLLAACYGAAPPRPPQIPLPPPQEGAAIAVHSESKTTWENVQKKAWHCPAGKGEGHPDCTYSTYSVKEPITRTSTTATYGGEPINYAQFKVMTDPKYGDKVAAVGELSKRCQRANVPRYAGLASLAAGLIAGPIVAKYNGGVGTAITYGGVAGGGVVFGLGYFAFGGRDCNEARSIYNGIDYRAAQEWNTVYGADTATEMAALARQFNARHARSIETRRP